MKIARCVLGFAVLSFCGLQTSWSHADEMPRQAANLDIVNPWLNLSLPAPTDRGEPYGQTDTRTIMTDDQEWRNFMQRLKVGLRFHPHRMISFGFGRDAVLWADHLPKWRYGGTIQVDTADFMLRGFVDMSRRTVGASLWPAWYDITAMLAVGQGHSVGLQANSNIGAGGMSEFQLGHSNCHVYILATVLDADTLLGGRLRWNYPRLGIGLSWSY